MSGAISDNSHNQHNGTGAMTTPSGTSAERPTAAKGLIRYNSTLNQYEGSTDGSTWTAISSGGSGGVSADGLQGTGLISGGILTIGTDTAKFDIAAGTGIVVDNYTDPTSPSITEVSWTAFDEQTITNIGTQNQTFIAINSSGSIVQQVGNFTVEQRRDLITLGVLVHPNNTSITTVGPGYHFANDVRILTEDMYHAMGVVNISGNTYSANASANLTIDKSSGETFKIGGNYVNTRKNPNNVTDSSDTALNFFYKYADGSSGFTTSASPVTNIDPGFYDDGSGTLQAVGNKFTIKRIYYYTNSEITVIHYGQAKYNKLKDAQAAIESEALDIDPTLANASLRCWLIVKGDATDLTDSSKALFVSSGRFGSVSGSIVAGITDLQQSYNNSSTPEIVLDSTRGAITLQDASSPLGANLLEVQANGGGTDYLAVDVDGVSTSGAFTALGTGANELPTGTTAQRPAAAKGLLRYNSTLDQYEGSTDGSTWTALGAGGGGGYTSLDALDDIYGLGDF